MQQDKDKSAQSGYLVYFGDRIKKIALNAKESEALLRAEVAERKSNRECDYSQDTSSWD